MKLLDDYMRDVGSANADLRVPATVVKRRISERLPGGHADHPTSFIGRDEEMTLAGDSLIRTAIDGRHCLVIGGEPGIGKSRLASEFLEVVILSGLKTQRVTMQPQDARRPLGVFGDLVPWLLRLRGAIACSPASLQLLRRLTDPAAESISEAT